MRKIPLLSSFASIFGILVSGSTVFAADQIIRPFSSIRSMGMGGVRTTLGLYEENFFGNPALATENPRNKIQLFDINLEFNFGLIENAGKALANADDMIGAVSETSGTNTHLRAQASFPAFYFPNRGHGGKMSYAFALLTSVQTDFRVRKSYIIDPLSVIDVGPALTVARKMGVNEEFSVGATVHASYRVSSKRDFTVLDFLQGVSLSPSTTGGDGGMVDASIGANYKIPYAWENWKLSAGASVNNILGGQFSLYSLRLTEGGAAPRPQPRAFNLGVAGTRDLIGAFTQNRIALEFNDIGLNPNGSFFRWIHIGGETQYGVVKIRAGFNQGYLAFGLGFQSRILSFEVATTGEEMSLNTGGNQDRRYAFRFAIQI